MGNPIKVIFNEFYHIGDKVAIFGAYSPNSEELPIGMLCVAGSMVCRCVV